MTKQVATKKIFWLDDRIDQIAPWLDVLEPDPDFDTTHIDNLLDAVRPLEQNNYDLYIIDVMIPSWGGIPKEFRIYLETYNLSEPTELGGLLVAEYILTIKRSPRVVILTHLPVEGDAVVTEKRKNRAKCLFKGDARVTPDAIKGWCRRL